MDPMTTYLGYAVLVAVGFIAGGAVSEIRSAITANKIIKAIDNGVKPEKMPSKKRNAPKQAITEKEVKPVKKRPYSEYTKKYRKKHNITTLKYKGVCHSVCIDHCIRVLGPTGRYHWEVKPEFAGNYSWLQQPTDSPSH